MSSFYSVVKACDGVDKTGSKHGEVVSQLE